VRDVHEHRICGGKFWLRKAVMKSLCQSESTEDADH